jgi:hypothetical protein
VESVNVGHGKIKINDHSELKQYYDDARRIGSTIRLQLINTEVANNIATGSAESEREWTGAGNWQGKAIVGWPGGAALRSIVEAKAKANVVNSRTDKIVTVEQPPGVNAAESASGLDEDAWTTIISTTTSSHRYARPIKPAVKGKEARAMLEKVRFTDKFEERSYLIDSMASEIRVKSSQVFDALATVSHDSLSDAVQHKQCDDVIRVLEEGSSEDATDPDALKGQYSAIDEALVEIRKQREKKRSSESLKLRESDLVQKKTVLNIFLNCTLIISKALSLKSWKTFEIRLRRISLKLAPRAPIPGKSSVLSGRVKTKINNAFGEVVSRLISFFRLRRPFFSRAPLFKSAVLVKPKATGGACYLHGRQRGQTV